MAEKNAQGFVLPEELPLEEIKGRDLEECAYWLLHSMGARDLEWRAGGSGGGAADGGRDLEAVFYVPSPDGEMEPQRWWIECKGRKGTVDPDDVKSAVNNAMALGNLAQLVIVTNTTFSNPTRDWVKTWQASRPWPKVKLWDAESLKRLISQHPDVALRLFSEALSPDGLLQVTKQRFWHKLEYTPVRALKTFWASRDTLKIEPMERVALIANEFAHGSIIERPWAAHAPFPDLCQALATSLQNLGYLVLRAEKMGVDREPLLEAIAHILLLVIRSANPVDLATFLVETPRARDEGLLPEQVLEFLLLPVVDRLVGEMQDVCSQDCMRVSSLSGRSSILEEDPLAVYWERVNPEGRPVDVEARKRLTLFSLEEPCAVGFPVDRERSCPLFDVELKVQNIPELLSVIERVANFRVAEFRGKQEGKAKRDATQQAGSGTP